MKFKRLIMPSAILSAVVSTTVMAAPASKFSAHVDNTSAYLLQSGVADTMTPSGSACAGGNYFYDAGYDVCYTSGDTQNILNASIKTPNKKDLLIGVSLESALFTHTEVKGKNGSSEKAGAEAGVMVRVLIDPIYSNTGDLQSYVRAYPDNVVFAKRIQELTATLGGVIESCDVSLEVTGTADGSGNVTGTADGTINIADDCIVSDEEIGLILNTTSANHFNFVAPNMLPGDHAVVVEATAVSSAAFSNGSYLLSDSTLSEAECVGDPKGTAVYENDGSVEVYVGCEIETTDNSAKAYAVINIGSLTVEEVRAINQDGGITIDMDQ